MPVLKVYHHGLTGGVPPRENNHSRSKRGECEGWSYSSTRSNTRFLYSVDESGLTGAGLALTLTLRDCPDSHDDWHKLRLAFFHRMRRLGLIRAHWLTEWQKRGVPHLHCALWLPELGKSIISHWLDLAGVYGAVLHGQHNELIRDSVGWFKYLSKHASRGLHHYQRSPEGIPKGWRKTGRMWGVLGEWPTREAIRLELDDAGFYTFRRIVRNYRIADARASGSWRRVSQARRMLNCNEPKRAAVRGISEWIELETQLQIVTHLAAMGHQVVN